MVIVKHQNKQADLSCMYFLHNIARCGTIIYIRCREIQEDRLCMLQSLMMRKCREIS